MFGFFERLINPFPAQAPQPPRGIFQFCRYYTRVLNTGCC